MFDGMRKIAGALLMAAALGAQVGNTLVCVVLLLLGPAVVLGLLSK